MTEDRCTCPNTSRIMPHLRAIELRPGQHFLSATGDRYERIPELDEYSDGEVRWLGCRRAQDGADDSISPLAWVTLVGEAP